MVDIRTGNPSYVDMGPTPKWFWWVMVGLCILLLIIVILVVFIKIKLDKPPLKQGVITIS